MKNRQKEILKQPTLRFPEFDGDWVEKRLGEVIAIVMGQSPNSDSYNEDSIGIPLIQGNNDIRNRVSEAKRYTSRPTKICKAGDLLITVRAPVGIVSIASCESCIGRGVATLQGADKFIYYLLMSRENKWKKISQGSTFSSISKSDISQLNIYVTGQNEQSKITKFLSLIDKRIETQSKILQEKKKLFKSLLKFKFENLKSPKKRIKDLANIYQPKTISKDNLSNKYFYPTYGANGIIGKYHSYNHKTEQVLISCRGVSCGNIHFTKPKAWINGNTLVINIDDIKCAISKKFLYYYLKSINLSKYISGSAQPQITRESIGTLMITCPNTNAQESIVNAFEKIEQSVDKERMIIQNLVNMKKYLLNNMFI